MLHHSDQGCTYASEDYQAVLEARGIVCSMSRRGNCYDNAVMESFFSTVKSELGEHFESHGVAKMEVFDYIEVFLQPATPTLDAGADQSGRVRTVRTRRGHGRHGKPRRPRFPTAPTPVPVLRDRRPKTDANHVVKPSTESDQGQYPSTPSSMRWIFSVVSVLS